MANKQKHIFLMWTTFSLLHCNKTVFCMWRAQVLTRFKEYVIHKVLKGPAVTLKVFLKKSNNLTPIWTYWKCEIFLLVTVFPLDEIRQEAWATSLGIWVISTYVVVLFYNDNAGHFFMSQYLHLWSGIKIFAFVL